MHVVGQVKQCKRAQRRIYTIVLVSVRVRFDKNCIFNLVQVQIHMHLVTPAHTCTPIQNTHTRARTHTHTHTCVQKSYYSYTKSFWKVSLPL